MTQEEILQYNKRCVEFLNLHRDEEVVIYNMHSYCYDLLKFDSDWNWLMEAIQFLHKHFESKERSWTSIERYPLYTDIETVFVLVSDFAKHYNEGKL